MTNQRGFTMIEMAIVLAIMGLLVGGGVMATAPLIDKARVTQTNANLDQIENALVLFAIRNNRLPCPADGSITLASANAASYGLEQYTAAAGTSPGTCSTAQVPLINSVIPWKTLGIDEQYSLDGWGNRIAYFPAGGQSGWDTLVDKGISGSGASATAALSVTTPGSLVSPLTIAPAGAGYSSTLLPAVILYGGGTGSIFAPAQFTASSSASGISNATCTANCGTNYTSPPTVVFGTAGCLYRNGGGTNGRWSYCDNYLAGANLSYLTPSLPYGNYIAVYSISGTQCSSEATTPNNTALTAQGNCTTAPTVTGTTIPNFQNVTNFGNRAAYVLISHGKSGWYAWNKAGVRMTPPNGNYQLKLYNADGSAGQAGNKGFVQGNPIGAWPPNNASYFDDIVRWRTPSMIIQLCGSGACGNP